MPLPPHLVFYLASHFTLLKLTLAQYYHLTPHELLALGVLLAKGPMGFKELRQFLRIPKTNLTYLMDALEKRGLAKRERSSRDRREWIAVLTPRGVDLSQDISERETATLQPLLGPLSEGESPSLVRALEQPLDIGEKDYHHRNKRRPGGDPNT